MTPRERGALYRARNLDLVRTRQREWARRRYQADPVAVNQRQKLRRRPGLSLVQISNQQMLRDLKSAPCAGCGERFHYACMDFDHRDGESKVAGVSRMLSFSRERVLAEVAKCDVVCANCHRLRTFTRQGGVL